MRKRAFLYPLRFINYLEDPSCVRLAQIRPCCTTVSISLLEAEPRSRARPGFAFHAVMLLRFVHTALLLIREKNGGRRVTGVLWTPRSASSQGSGAQRGACPVLSDSKPDINVTPQAPKRYLFVTPFCKTRPATGIHRVYPKSPSSKRYIFSFTQNRFAET